MGRKDKSKKAVGVSETSASVNGNPVASTSSKSSAASNGVANAVATTSKQSSSAKSEIDDIFAGKKKTLPAQTSNESGTSTSQPSESKSSKKRKRKAQVDESIGLATSSTDTSKLHNGIALTSGLDVKEKGKSAVKDANASSKEANPKVTVVDASSIPGLATSDSSKKRRKSDKISETNTTSASSTAADTASKEEDELFRDSRGTSRRRTDDGLPIYDIKELNIGLGGHTELCPFDCDCCF